MSFGLRAGICLILAKAQGTNAKTATDQGEHLGRKAGKNKKGMLPPRSPQKTPSLTTDQGLNMSNLAMKSKIRG